MLSCWVKWSRESKEWPAAWAKPRHGLHFWELEMVKPGPPHWLGQDLHTGSAYPLFVGCLFNKGTHCDSRSQVNITPVFKFGEEREIQPNTGTFCFKVEYFSFFPAMLSCTTQKLNNSLVWAWAERSLVQTAAVCSFCLPMTGVAVFSPEVAIVIPHACCSPRCLTWTGWTCCMDSTHACCWNGHVSIKYLSLPRYMYTHKPAHVYQLTGKLLSSSAINCKYEPLFIQ